MAARNAAAVPAPSGTRQRESESPAGFQPPIALLRATREVATEVRFILSAMYRTNSASAVQDVGQWLCEAGNFWLAYVVARSDLDWGIEDVTDEHGVPFTSCDWAEVVVPPGTAEHF